MCLLPFAFILLLFRLFLIWWFKNESNRISEEKAGHTNTQIFMKKERIFGDRNLYRWMNIRSFELYKVDIFLNDFFCLNRKIIDWSMIDLIFLGHHCQWTWIKSKTWSNWPTKNYTHLIIIIRMKRYIQLLVKFMWKMLR